MDSDSGAACQTVEVIKSIDNNIEYFDKRAKPLSSNLSQLKAAISKCVKATNEIETFAPVYDFDVRTPGNGYRSFLNVFKSAIEKSGNLLGQLIKARRRIFFALIITRSTMYTLSVRPSYSSFVFVRSEINDWAQIFESLSEICKALIELHRSNTDGSLYSECEGHENKLSQTIRLIDLKPFYGRNVGFQFCGTVQPLMKLVVVIMTSYFAFYVDTKLLILKFIDLMVTVVRFLINPVELAASFLQATRKGTIDFFRLWWEMPESKLLYAITKFRASKPAVYESFEIQPEKVEIFSEKVGKLIEVPIPSSHVGPASVSCVLISQTKRQGMIGVSGSTEKPSKQLIFQVHGGGWASQSTKSHEASLREWAVELDIPILSINYTLSTVAPFPRAVEEVFFAYCWALKNPERLGWTGEDVLLVGDSAGGNLNTSCVIQCIEKGIRKPLGLFNLYSPFRIGSHDTPARFLTLIDSVLPNALTLRLMETYCGQRKSTNADDGTPEKSNDEHIEYNKSYLISPSRCPDEILREFPRTNILTTDMDPCLDDGVEFAKTLRRLNVDVHLDVLSGLHHGFLYWIQLSKDCNNGSATCVERIKSLFKHKNVE